MDGPPPQPDRYFAHNDFTRLAELHLGVPAAFTILDATRACLTGGPFPGGVEAAPGIIVASADPVAVDVTGLAILKRYLDEAGVSNRQIQDRSVWDQPQIARAMEIGIGIGSPSDYESASSGVDEIGESLAFIEGA